MAMNIHAALLLQAVYYFNGERSINGIIHLLKGKRSIQSIQDGYLFNVLPLYGLLSKSDPTDILDQTKVLENEKLIVEIKENYYQITDYGKDKLQIFFQQHYYLLNISGYQYKDISKTFWLRVLLTIQTLSFTLKENLNFIPVTQDKKTLLWAKRHFPKHLEERKKWAMQMYSEIEMILSGLSEVEAMVCVYKLSGVKTLGLTNEQIGELVKRTKIEVDFILTSVVHYCLTEVKNNPSKFPMFTLLTKDLFNVINVTESAKKTLILFEEGYSIPEIATLRALKEGTIEDHFIEIIIENPSLSIERFVSSDIEQEIVAIASQIGTTRLRPIKDKMGDRVSFFQIRLVLTKLGGLNDGSIQCT